MSIANAFRELRKRNEGALIAYVTGGDPSPKHTPRIVKALVEGGADIIEIGIPFSDPIADGPVIQASDVRALNAGTTPNTVFEIVREVKKTVNIPIVILTYYNIIFRRGVGRFLESASRSNVDGVIVADLPVEEAEEYKNHAEKNGVDTIFLAAPSTPLNRLEKILKMASGFLYLVSVFGVTGMREHVAQLTMQTIRKIRPYTINRVPLAVGFGISKPEHVGSVISCGADGAIVGSAFVRLIEEKYGDFNGLLEELTAYAKIMKLATKLRSQFD
ncbi:MAG: tryptophan synthase subunit alpha [Candidatus Brockarchaeota archaeon]|nr:tryptophan synthase subunit alpha [Candidatus Brockarchaeota archaeon]